MLSPHVVSRASIPNQSAHPLAFVSAVGVLLLAFLLRVHRLADQTVWWDEGWTIWMGHQSLVTIALRTASDEHPPLHYWLMHFWNDLAGAQAFNGRLLSAFFGVLTIAVLCRIANRCGGVWFGALAALLLALARFHIWWSQDIKNYTLSGFFALASAWFTLRLLDPEGQPGAPGRKRRWAGYVLTITLALYSHYLAALVFLANNVFAALQLLRLWRGRAGPLPAFGRWSLAQLAALALFAPWLWLYLSSATTWSAAPASDFSFFLRLTATVFSVGVISHLERYAPVVLFMLALAALGTAWVLRARAARRKSDAALMGLLIVLLPPLLIYTLSLTPAAFFAPKIQPRYLLIFLPGYVLLIGLGLLWIARFSRPLALVALAAALLAQTWLLADYFRGRRLHDEYFTLVNIVNTFAQPGDAILLHTDQDWPTFLYYLQAPIPWEGVLAGGEVNEATAEGYAVKMASRFPAVWVVITADALAKDPQHLVEAHLARLLPKQFERVIDDQKVALYARAPRDLQNVPPENFRVQRARALNFSADLKWLGYDLPVREASGGDTLHVVTYWEARRPATVTVELRDTRGAPLRVDTQAIAAGPRVRLQSDLTLPPGASGDYTVFVTAEATGQPVAAIRVEPRVAPVAASGIPHPVDYRLGAALHLVGYDLPSAKLGPGEELSLTLFWKSNQTVETSYKVFVHLVGAEFNPALNNPLWGQVDRAPLEGVMPTTAWEPGIVIPDAYRVPLDPNAPPGAYRLTVGLYDPVSGERLRVYDAAGSALGDEILISPITVVDAPSQSPAATTSRPVQPASEPRGES